MNRSGRSTQRTGARGISRSTTPNGTEIARVTKKWAGFLREGFTTADHYVLEITGPTSADLRFLLVASAAALDTALKQDDSGGWGFGGIDLTDLIP